MLMPKLPAPTAYPLAVLPCLPGIPASIPPANTKKMHLLRKSDPGQPNPYEL